MLKLVGALFCALVLAQKSLFEDHNQLYNYEYTLDIEYQRPQKSEDFQTSKVSISAGIDITSHGRDTQTNKRILVLNMKNLSIKSENSDEHSEPDESQFPVIFTLTDRGAVDDIFMSQSESEWIANLKRGVLSQLQVELSRSVPLAPFVAEESDVTGLNIQYSYTSEPSDTNESELKIVKERLFADKKSTSQLTFHIDHLSGHVAQIETQDSHFVDMDDLDGVNTKVKSFSKFVSKQDISDESLCKTLGCVVNYISAKYQLPEGGLASSSLQLIQSDDVEQSHPLLSLILAPESEQNVMMDRKLATVIEVAELINQNRQAFSGEFHALVEMLKSDRDLMRSAVGLVSRHDIQSVVVDAYIAICDDEAFRLLKQEAVFDMSNEVLINRILVDLGYVPATWDMLDFALKIVENDKVLPIIKSTAALSLGSMVRKIGEHRMYRYAWHCLWRLEQQLKSSQFDHDMILYMHAIGNAGKQPSIHVVEPFLTDVTKSEEVRYAAVFAMRHMEPRDAKSFLLKAYNDHTLKAETRIMAFGFCFPALDDRDKETILREVMTEQDVAVKEKILEFFPEVFYAKQASKAIYELADEFVLAGHKKLNAVAGYRFTLYNPLKPSGADRVLGNGETFLDVNAFKRRQNIFRGVVRVQGDLFKRKRDLAPEAFLYVSVAGTVWDECIDLFGTACQRRHCPEEIDGEILRWKLSKCVSQNKTVLNFSAVLFRMEVKIPLIVGIGLRMEQQFVSHSLVTATAKGCRFPFTGVVNLLPDLGVVAVAQASINLFVVRAGVRLNAKLLDTTVKTNLNIDAGSFPVQACADIDVNQKKVRGTYQFFVQFRKIRWCKKIFPCGFPWGKERTITKEFSVLKDYQKKLLEKCLAITLPFGGEQVLLVQQ